ncbi:hypothetical protein [Hymenobacter terrigena]
MLAGDRGILSRAITLVESNREDHRRQAQELLVELLPHAGGARTRFRGRRHPHGGILESASLSGYAERQRRR